MGITEQKLVPAVREEALCPGCRNCFVHRPVIGNLLLAQPRALRRVVEKGTLLFGYRAFEVQEMLAMKASMLSAFAAAL